MDNFADWYRWRKYVEDFDDFSDSSDKFRFNSDNDHLEMGRDHEKDLGELLRVIMARYQDDFMQFLERLGQNDYEIKEMIRKLKNEKPPSALKEPPHITDVDSVVPPEADRGHSDGAEAI